MSRLNTGLYQPCFDRRDNRTDSDIFFNVNGAVYIAIPDRWLIVPIDHVELDVDVGGGRRNALVRRVHLQAVPLTLRGSGGWRWIRRRVRIDFVLVCNFWFLV